MSNFTLPQDLMTNSMLHFENGVPIDDLKLRPDQRRRLARVQHVYWQWVKNPWLDARALFRQLVKGHFADAPTECRAAQKDFLLFEFIRDRVAGPSRRESEAKVRAAAEKAIQIGMETDNVNALTKGGQLLYNVAGLDKPENEQADMSKVMFLPPVVTTSVAEIDETKTDVDDSEMKRIMAKYGGFVDEKVKDVDKRVEVMIARREAGEVESEK